MKYLMQIACLVIVLTMANMAMAIHTTDVFTVTGAGKEICNGTYTAQTSMGYTDHPFRIPLLSNGTCTMFMWTSDSWAGYQLLGWGLSNNDPYSGDSSYYRSDQADNPYNIPLANWTLGPSGIAPIPTITLTDAASLQAPPNGALVGDTTGDGIEDWKRPNVGTVKSITSSTPKFMTIKNSDDLYVFHARADDPRALGTVPAGVTFPAGGIEYEMYGTTVGGSYTVVLYTDLDPEINALYKRRYDGGAYEQFPATIEHGTYKTKITYVMVQSTSTTNSYDYGPYSNRVIEYVAPGKPCAAPVANITANKTSGVVPLIVTFSGSTSTGMISSYSWDFGDGSTGTGADISHTFSSVGSYTVTLTVTGDGGSNSATQAITVSNPPINGSQSDLIYRNTLNNQVHIVQMEGKNITNTSESLGVVADFWYIGGTGDFNGDYKTDILWRNRNNGRTVVWFMNGTTRTSFQDIEVANLNWEIQGCGDFNRDGKTDILWRNKNNGKNVIWYMDGVTRTSFQEILQVNQPWRIYGTGDFNDDDKIDIVWRNDVTGRVVVWYMDNTTRLAWSDMGSAITAWTLNGVGNLNGDSYKDLIWTRTITEFETRPIVWYMDKHVMTGFEPFKNRGYPYKLIGIGSFH